MKGVIKSVYKIYFKCSQYRKEITIAKCQECWMNKQKFETAKYRSRAECKIDNRENKE